MTGNPIEYRRGDLFNDYDKSLRTVLVHGCNAQGVMGSGVARIFRDKYPEAYDTYQHDILGGMCLGDISIHKVDKRLTLVSAITQEFYGRDGKRYVSYDAVNNAFLKVMDYAIIHGVTQIVFPKIGAGLGGGDWNIIEACIVSAHHEVMVGDVKIICFTQ